MNRRTTIVTALMVALATTAASARFSPIVTDFSNGLQPFTGAALDTVQYSSGPSSMRIAHQYTGAAKSTGAYAGTTIQTNFWTGPGFPENPTRFFCMLRDLSLGAAGHEMDIHLNFGSTDYGYSWLGIYYFTRSAFSGEWEVGMDETIDDIGSLRNPWAGQPTFREMYDQLYGTRDRKPAVVLTLVIETTNGAICIDDLSVAMLATPVRQSQPLTVLPAARANRADFRVVTADGRILNGAGRNTAMNFAAGVANGLSRGTIIGR